MPVHVANTSSKSEHEMINHSCIIFSLIYNKITICLVVTSTILNQFMPSALKLYNILIIKDIINFKFALCFRKELGLHRSTRLEKIL